MKRRYLFSIVLGSICLLSGAIFCACDPPTHTHTFEFDRYIVAPDCTHGGEMVQKCSWSKTGRGRHCEEERTVRVDPLGHDWGDVRILRQADCLNVGMERRVCKRCEIEQDTVSSPMLAHTYRDGKCAACGRRDWTHAEIDDLDLYSGDYSFHGLAALEQGAQMQTLYREIEADARDFHVSGRSLSVLELGEYDYKELDLTFDDVVTVWKAFMDDHPLYYWLSRTLVEGDKAVVEINEEYADTYTRAELNALIYDTARRWREESSENAYYTALCYHDKILDAVDYAYDTNRQPSSASWAHNIVGVFQEQGAVCEGYARTFQLLLNASGIENIFVTGPSGDVDHAWNLVKLDDGKWYWADLTYDDDYQSAGSKCHYFLVDGQSDLNWQDYGWETEIVLRFSDNHTVATGTGVDYMPHCQPWRRLPIRAAASRCLGIPLCIAERTIPSFRSAE